MTRSRTIEWQTRKRFLWIMYHLRVSFTWHVCFCNIFLDRLKLLFWAWMWRKRDYPLVLLYLLWTVLADELHGLALGRNIIKNLHTAGNQGLHGALQSINSKYKEPLFDVKELRSIAPTDHKQQFDIRSIIARIVDGSEFDEFKKLYGTVRAFAPIQIYILSFITGTFKYLI